MSNNDIQGEHIYYVDGKVAMPKTARASHEKLLLDEIRTARNLLNKAKNIKCSCSGFVLQYQGCSCGRREEIYMLETALSDLIDSI